LKNRVREDAREPERGERASEVALRSGSGPACRAGVERAAPTWKIALANEPQEKYLSGLDARAAGGGTRTGVERIDRSSSPSKNTEIAGAGP
jgi:hypothetical protein